MFSKLFCTFFILELMLFALVLFLWHMTTASIVVLAVLALFMLVLGGLRTWNNPNLDFSGWSLHLDEEKIYLGDDPKGTVINRSEIAEIVSSGSGTVVKGEGFGKRIWIPSGVENCEQLNAKLKGWVNSA